MFVHRDSAPLWEGKLDVRGSGEVELLGGKECRGADGVFGVVGAGDGHVGG